MLSCRPVLRPRPHRPPAPLGLRGPRAHPGVLPGPDGSPGCPRRSENGPGAESAAANAQAEAAAAPPARPSPGPAAAMGLLNFTREPVPEAVSADMHNLNQLSAQVRRDGQGRGGHRGPARTRNGDSGGAGRGGPAPGAAPGAEPARCAGPAACPGPAALLDPVPAGAAPIHPGAV